MLVRDAARVADVREKQQRIAEWLDKSDADAVLLLRPDNIAWFTSGADVTRGGSSDVTAAVFVTAEARLVVSNNIDAPQLFERELFGLGFQLKQRAWHEPISVLLQDLVRGRTVVCDSFFPNTNILPANGTALRGTLTSLECERLRKLSRVAAHAVEATALSFDRGATEAEVAAQVAHRLIKRNVQPERIQVCADGRSQRFRHWSFGRDRVNQSAVISCVARRWGLHAGVTRTVAFESIPAELRSAHEKTVLMHATGMFFSKRGIGVPDLWRKVKRIYEKFGMPFEWQLSDQAEVIGYGVRETSLVTDRETELRAPSAVFWHPAVGPSMAGDTILVQEQGTELLTSVKNWKKVKVKVRGISVQVADILIREQDIVSEQELTASDQLTIQKTSMSDPDILIDSVWEMDVVDAGS